jgi:hypothetical protein
MLMLNLFESVEKLQKITQKVKLLHTVLKVKNKNFLSLFRINFFWHKLFAPFPNGSTLNSAIFLLSYRIFENKYFDHSSNKKKL